MEKVVGYITGDIVVECESPLGFTIKPEVKVGENGPAVYLERESGSAHKWKYLAIVQRTKTYKVVVKLGDVEAFKDISVEGGMTFFQNFRFVSSTAAD